MSMGACIDKYRAGGMPEKAFVQALESFFD
jgi:hypothetical protein